MSAARSSTIDPGTRGFDPRAPRSRAARALLIALLAGLAVFALPTALAFGEGSGDLNTGPDAAARQALGNGTILSVYAQAGETLQLGSSATGSGSGNILVYAPGADTATATPVWSCTADDPGTGVIATRAQELAGPLPNAGGYVPCEFAPPDAGIYSVIMVPPDPGGANNTGGTVGAPNQTAGVNVAMFDITVRDGGGAVQEGRAFSYRVRMRTTGAGASGVGMVAFTKTGYEYAINLYDQAGINWDLVVNDVGVVDSVTGERTFASFACGNDQPANNQCQFTDAQFEPIPEYPLFFSRVDPVVVSGAGGLGATRGYSATPISPASQPLANAAFTGSGNQAGATNHGSGGTIAFTSPTQMESLGYTVLIDTDRNGTFGGGTDYVDGTADLSATGNNTYAWSGRDAAGNVPACGNYSYQVRSTLAEVHFSMHDVENSGGTRIERLSLPGDASLGDPLAASYNNHDPYKNGYVVTNGTPSAVTNGISGPGFNAWSDNSGNTDVIDTWARLPEVQTAGTLRLLCADPTVVKTAEPAAVVPGEDLTFRLTVTNNGPDAATNVVVTDDLPDTVTFELASAGCSEAASVVTCTLASLAAGASHTFEIRVAVPSDADECIDNTGTVTNDTPDTNPLNNSSTNCWPLRRRSNLSMRKDASRTTLPAEGGQVMYTLVVRNHGPSDDPDVKVSDPLAAGLTLVAADPSQGTCTTTNNTVSCDMGALKEGGSAQVLVTATVHGTPGCITNTSRVQGANQDPSPGNNEDSARVCVEEGPPTTFDLDVTKRASDRSLLIGQKVTYRVLVANNGPAAAPDVTLTDTINAAVTVVSVKTTAGSCTKRIPMRCELGTIAARDGVTITIVVKHREATKCSPRQRQAASAVGNGTDTNPANNMDTVDVCVREIPKLRITKVADRESVQAGDTFGYRIRVRNPSRGEATPVRVCDRLPSGLRFVSSLPVAERQGGQRCWRIRALGAGKSRTFRVRVRAARGALGRKVNRASASSPDVTRRARARDQVRVLGVATPVTG